MIPVNYDSDSEALFDPTTSSESGFLFKDTYFEDREVENLVLECDPEVGCSHCGCDAGKNRCSFSEEETNTGIQ